MENKDFIKVKGQVRLQVFDGDKLIQDTGFSENIITAVGLASIAGLVGNTGAITAFTYLAVGSDATAAAIGQTTLVAEIATNGLSRASATVSRLTTNQTNDTLQLTKTFSVSGSSTVNEVGVFNAASTGSMLARKVTSSSVAVVSGNSLVVTYQVIIA